MIRLKLSKIPALYSLEDDWTEIVEGSSGLSERLKSQQTALWELISTELAFIRTLKVIQDVSNKLIADINMTISVLVISKLSMQPAKQLDPLRN